MTTVEMHEGIVNQISSAKEHILRGVGLCCYEVV